MAMAASWCLLLSTANALFVVLNVPVGSFPGRLLDRRASELAALAAISTQVYQKSKRAVCLHQVVTI
jgi:hypothetical protein